MQKSPIDAPTHARQTTDEEVSRWRITPRAFEADAEDALTRLAQDFWAATQPADKGEKALANAELAHSLRQVVFWYWELRKKEHNGAFTDAHATLLTAAAEALTRPPAPLEGIETSVGRDIKALEIKALRTFSSTGKNSVDALWAEHSIKVLIGEVDRLTADLATAKRERDVLEQRAVADMTLAYGWMKAHDKLNGWLRDSGHLKELIESGFTYKLPEPADVPNAIARAEAAEAELATVKRVADDAWRVHAENDRLRGDNLRLRNERDGALEALRPFANAERMTAKWSGPWFVAICPPDASDEPRFSTFMVDDIRKAFALVYPDQVADSAIKRPSPGTDK